MQSKACWLRMIVALLFVVQYVVAATSELNAYMLRLCDTRISPEVVANLQTKYKIQLDHFVQHDSFFLIANSNTIAKLKLDDAICSVDLYKKQFARRRNKQQWEQVTEIHALLATGASCEAIGKAIVTHIATTRYRCASSRMISFTSTAMIWQELTQALELQPQVLSIETPIKLERHSSEEKWIIQSNEVDYTPFTSAGLTGANQVIAIADDGLNVNNCFFYDSSTQVQYTTSRKNLTGNTNHRKVLLYYAYVDDLASRHGTHTSGSATGASSTSNAPATRINSMASDAKLVFMDIGCEKSVCNCTDDSCTSKSVGNGGLNIPLDIGEHMLGVLDKAGAKISSHSYGSPEQQYMFPSQSLLVDDFLNKNEDNIALYSAGNYGRGGMHTLGPYAASKNGITVGNSYNSRRVWSDAFSAAEIRQYLNVQTLPLRIRNNQTLLNATMEVGNCCFLYNSPCEFDINLSIDVNQRLLDFAPNNIALTFAKDSVNAAIAVSCCPICAIKLLENMLGTVFDFNTSISDSSSIGPTVDGRIKPDVIAPGSLILSANHSSSFTCDASAYVALTGTSMATPTMASAVALVRQYFVDGYYPSGAKNANDALVPSGVLLKAIVIHSARLMQNYSGYVFNNPLANGYARYRFVKMNNLGSAWVRGLQGHGLVNLKNALPLKQTEPFNLFVFDRVVMPTITANQTYAFSTTNACTLVVTLAWADVPGSPLANKMLVNDLDLTVRLLNPETSYMGNYDPLFPLINEVDSLNNVEKIIVPNVPANTLIFVHVTAKRLISQQKYALVVTGNLKTEPVPTSQLNIGLILGIAIPITTLVLFVTACGICVLSYFLVVGCKKEQKSITDMLLEKELNP